MKKQTLIILVLVCVSAASFAQSRLGLQAGYGFEIEKPFAGLNGEFFLADRVSIAPDISFYAPEQATIFGTQYKVSFWELNGDLHFYFNKGEKASFYALGGVNHVTAKVKAGSQSASDSETGANVGLGVSFSSPKSVPFIQFKYETVGTGQFVIMGGVRFPLK
jgi:opacity protein-like surface antigen